MAIKLENVENEKLVEWLWKITYGAEGVLDDIDLSDDIPIEEFGKLLIKEVRKESRNLNFANENPICDTYGVDLGITNPIVRDIIIMKIYDVLDSKEKGDIWKIIKLFKTPEDDLSFDSSKRYYGGLRTMGFNNEEAVYIKDTCPLYPISLMLERALNANVAKSNSNIEIDKEKEIFNVNIQRLLKNKESITKVLKICSSCGITTLEEFDNTVNGLFDATKMLEQLKKDGITLDYLLPKGVIINQLYEIDSSL